jgi:hypothetical protein
MNRPCPFHGCVQTLPDYLFACKAHWFTLSPEERDCIWNAYRCWHEGNLGSNELRRIQQDVLGDRGTA